MLCQSSAPHKASVTPPKTIPMTTQAETSSLSSFSVPLLMMGLRAVDPVPLQTRHDQPRFLSIWNPDASCDIIVMTSLPRPCHKNVPGGASLARVPHRPRGASPGVAKRRCLRSMLNHDWLSHL